jgi:hypothetical protein
MSTSITPTASWKFATLPLLVLTLLPLAGCAIAPAEAPAPAQSVADLGAASCQAATAPTFLPSVTFESVAAPSAGPTRPRHRQMPGDEGCRETPPGASR